MDKVVLSKTARKALGERLGRNVPDPNSEEFDELLEELREMRPDDYTDLMGALEYSGDKLPVEKEALRAHNRAKRQKLANNLKNRETHDGKTVPDKRKSILVGGVLAAMMMGWIGYTNVSRMFIAQAATAENVDEIVPVNPAKIETNQFGVRNDVPTFAVDIDVPQPVRVAQTAPPPPPKETPKPVESPQADAQPTSQPDKPEQKEGLLYGLGRPLKASTTQPESGLPAAPSPPQPGVASAPPSPYLPPGSGGAGTTATAEAAVLPANLSFDPLNTASEGPTNALSSEGEGNALPSTPGTTLAAGEADPSTQAQGTPPPPSLGGTESEEPTPAASSLGWDDPDGAERAVEEKTLSFAQTDSQAGLSDTSAQPLPPVPQVGGEPTPPPPTPSPDSEPQAEPEITDLSTLLTPGTQLEAQLVTGVAAADGAATPVIAKTTGNWCGAPNCAEITWIGEASYPGTNRVELTFSQAVVGNTAQGVSAKAFGDDQLPGVPAGVRDVAPTAVQDLMRGAVGGASDYLDAFNNRETIILKEGEIVKQQAEPDFGTYLLGRGTELFSLPSDQTSIVRLAEVAPGTPFTVIYGL